MKHPFTVCRRLLIEARAELAVKDLYIDELIHLLRPVKPEPLKIVYETRCTETYGIEYLYPRQLESFNGKKLRITVEEIE